MPLSQTHTQVTIQTQEVSIIHMASTAAPESEKAAAPPPEALATEVEKAVRPPAVPPNDFFVVADLILRLLLLAAAVTAVVVMVTSKQTETAPFQPVPRTAEFNNSAALIYFVAALSAAGLYSIITLLVSFYVLMKPDCSTKLLYHFLVFDVLMLGIVAAATGAGGAVAYIGLKGNSHVSWPKICNVYDKFCQYTAASLAVSLFASIVLALLVILSAYSLSKKIPN